MVEGDGSEVSIFLVVVVAVSVIVDALVSNLIVVDGGVSSLAEVVVSDSCCCVVSGSGLSVIPEVAGDSTGEGRLVLFGRI